MAYTKKKLNYEGVTKFIDELAKLPDAVENIIARKDEIHLLAKKAACKRAYFYDRTRI